MRLYLKNDHCYAEVIKIENVDYYRVTLQLSSDIVKSFNFENAYGKSLFDDENLNALLYKDLVNILNKSNELHKYLVEKHNFVGFLHETTINNLIHILEDGKLKSRYMLDQFDDSANYEVIEHTAEEVKKCVRFYFYPGTPTNYRFNQKNPNDLVYIVFKWDLILIDGAKIVNGNASSKHSKTMLANDYILNYEKSNFMDWDSIFHRGCLPSDDACYYGLASFDEKNDIRRKRNAEINIPNYVTTDYIDKIVFKTKEAGYRFIDGLKDDIITDKGIKLDVDPRYFS